FTLTRPCRAPVLVNGGGKAPEVFLRIFVRRREQIAEARHRNKAHIAHAPGESFLQQASIRLNQLRGRHYQRFDVDCREGMPSRPPAPSQLDPETPEEVERQALDLLPKGRLGHHQFRKSRGHPPASIGRRTTGHESLPTPRRSEAQ